MTRKTITLRRPDLTKIEKMLERHRVHGKFGWHILRAGNQKYGHPICQSAAASAREIINLEVQEAFDIARFLSLGERVWADAVKLIVAALPREATLEMRLQALQAICRARSDYRPKNASLSRRLLRAVMMRIRIDDALESGDRTGADLLACQGVRMIASLLRGRCYLVLLPRGVKRAQSKYGKPHDYTVDEIDKAVRTWANYPGFSGESCSECRATANVLAGGPGWFCECGQYNNQCFHGGMMPHDTPDYGPACKTIVRGNHKSCDASCSYCAGKRKLAHASPSCEPC